MNCLVFLANGCEDIVSLDEKFMQKKVLAKEDFG